MSSHGQQNTNNQRGAKMPTISEDYPAAKHDGLHPSRAQRQGPPKHQRTDKLRQSYPDRTRVSKHREPTFDGYDRLCSRVDNLITDLKQLQDTVDVLIVRRRDTRRQTFDHEPSLTHTDSSQSDEAREAEMQAERETDYLYEQQQLQQRQMQDQAAEHHRPYLPHPHTTHPTYHNPYTTQRHPQMQTSYTNSFTSSSQSNHLPDNRTWVSKIPIRPSNPEPRPRCKPAMPDTVNGMKLRSTDPKVVLRFVQHWNALVDRNRHSSYTPTPGGGSGSVD